MPDPIEGSSEFLLYQTEGGETRVQVRLFEGTVWLTQRLISELYQKSVPTINEHIKNIYEEGELDPQATIRKFRIVQQEGIQKKAEGSDFFGGDLKAFERQNRKFAEFFGIRAPETGIVYLPGKVL